MCYRIFDLLRIYPIENYNSKQYVVTHLCDTHCPKMGAY